MVNLKDKVIDAAGEAAGAAVATGVGMVVAGLVGAIAGSTLGSVISNIGSDIVSRALSKKEKERIDRVNKDWLPIMRGRRQIKWLVQQIFLIISCMKLINVESP